MYSTLSQKSQKNSFFLVPQESYKSRVLQVRAYKYLKSLDIDEQFIETTKSKRTYIKTFSYAKAQIPRKFEQNYTLTLCKKQKRLTRVMDTYGHAVPVFSKVLKRRNVKKVTCPYIQTEDKFLKILQNSSSFRKNLTHVGIVLKAERQSDVSSRILFQLHRCTKLASLSVFSFGSTNPLTEKALAQEISIKTLRNFHVIFVWMSRSLLINTTQMLKTNSHLTDLSINVVEWKVKGNDQEFKSFLSAIQNLQNLKQLKLSNVALDSEHTNILLDSISQLKNLRYLGIGLGLFSREQYPSLRLICEQLQNLVDLSLEFNSVVLRAEFFAYLVLLQNLKKLHVKINFEEGLRPCLDDLREFFITHPLLEGFSFEAFQTPNLEEESFNELLGYLRLCPKITFLDLRVRRFAGRYPEVQAFNNLSESLGYLTNLQELSLNFHLWYPTRCDLSKLAQSLANLPRLKNLTVHFPMIEERSTQTLMIFCQNIVNLKELRLLKLEFCIDDQIDIETQLFGYLLERLPKLKELSIWYHDLTRSNSEVVTPFAHLEKIAIEKYQLTSFILANVLVYTYKLNAEGKEVR